MTASLSSASSEPLPAAPSIRDALRGFAAGSLSPRTVLDACLDAIARRNDTLNALPTRLPADRLRSDADTLQTALRSGAPVGLLAGQPYAAKDIHRTAGVRTTFGSPLYADHVPTRNDPIVQRLLDAGALLIGKSNTPEFAAGSQTFNPIFGATLNPWDPSRTVGGSSGGAACALATGMTVVADGSDLAASLRNPASFCGVVGLRPSSAMDPTLEPGADGFGTLSMPGPLARSVDDLRLAWRAIFAAPGQAPIATWAERLAQESAATGRGGHAGGTAGRHDAQAAPTSRTQGASRVGAGMPRAPRALRLAWTIDAGGSMPVSEPVARTMEATLAVLREAGVSLVHASPALADVDECFQVLRGLYFVENFHEDYKRGRDRMKDTVVWNIEYGLSLGAERIAWAHRTRTRLFAEMAQFLRGFDGWLLPTAQVLPFAKDLPYPTAINGLPLANYVQWLRSCYLVSATGHPALSLPCGFASDAPESPPLPVGLQVVGHWLQDEALMDVGETLQTLLPTRLRA